MHQEIDAAIAQVIRQTAFIGGTFVNQFEEAFAKYCGAKHAVGISNGTDAIRIALLASGVKPGDEIITVPNTFIATAEAILMCGCSIRFVDVNPVTFTIDAQKLSSVINRRTRAIVPVHLYGCPADMKPIEDIAQRHGLKVIGDAAQAHGAEYAGKKIGTFGDAVCFSFYPGKNLGAYGDAGAIVSNDGSLIKQARLLRDHGRVEKYTHTLPGFNCRLDGLQAAILSAKLPHLQQWTKRRNAIAGLYNGLLGDIPSVRLPTSPQDRKSVFHLYVIQTKRRDDMRAWLGARGIATGVHYPTPLHLQPAFRFMRLPKGSFPVSEMQAQECLSLPIFPELKDQQIRLVAQGVRNFLEQSL